MRKFKFFVGFLKPQLTALYLPPEITEETPNHYGVDFEQEVVNTLIEHIQREIEIDIDIFDTLESQLNRA